MPNYDDAAEEAGWKKKGTRWTHPGYPGKVYGNAREIYNEALPVKFKRALSADDQGRIAEPTVKPDPSAKPVMVEWTPEMGPHPDTVARKTGQRPSYGTRPAVDDEDRGPPTAFNKDVVIPSVTANEPPTVLKKARK